MTDKLATANQQHGRCQDYLSLLLSLYWRAIELLPEDEDIQSDILEMIEFIGSYDAHYQEWVLYISSIARQRIPVSLVRPPPPPPQHTLRDHFAHFLNFHFKTLISLEP